MHKLMVLQVKLSVIKDVRLTNKIKNQFMYLKPNVNAMATTRSTKTLISLSANALLAC